MKSRTNITDKYFTALKGVLLNLSKGLIRKLLTHLLNGELELSPSTHLFFLEYFPSLTLPSQHKSRLVQLPARKII